MLDKHKHLMHPLPQKEVLKRLLVYTAAHKKMIAAAMVLLIGGTAADLAGPILVQIFIDDYLTPRNLAAGALTALASAYLFLYAGSAVMNYFQSYMFQKIALAIIQQLRIDVFEKVEKLGLSFFDQFPAGGLISRITNDTEQVKELYITVLAIFVQNIVFLVGIFAAMFYLNPQLAAFALFILPVILCVIFLYRKYSAVYYAEMSEKLSDLNARLNESIQGMAVIQMFRQERRMNREFSGINQSHHNAWLKSMKLDGLLLRPAVDLISILALILVLTYFGITSFDSPVEIGIIYAFVNYLDRFFEPVNQIMQRLSLFQQAMISAGRVFRLMDHDEPGPVQKPKKDLKIQDGNIEFSRVSFSYTEGERVLKDISFQVKKGEMLAIVGHTGSGKSSIINALMRFYEIDAGNILIDGHSVDTFPENELRKNIGLVLQDAFMFTGDMKSNINLYDQSISEKKLLQAVKDAGAETFIQKLSGGLAHEVGERGSTLSTGERQLLSFARTIVRDPRILILDEATASVDTETETEIQKALERAREGRTTIAVAHRLSTIRNADHILVLKEGSIAEEGTHETLIAQKGIYERMYRLQKGGG
ncbi:ABC transporter ATP-binding protein [Alkalicoccus saliphilus]|uniref:Multidrug ABC transporter ATP-binding protein n=1 Tax=Alkalicoccus saliphilus TaxID=200989 RepID=A0A2T4U7U5_9BACI|nr:ABC transporter ATP-binding protein [Alkalicoccus saliphilus]PTL39478.1 multidrug ABC transporter ATP-binding protein [Alkalicoccus saliphilus]